MLFRNKINLNCILLGNNKACIVLYNLSIHTGAESRAYRSENPIIYKQIQSNLHSVINTILWRLLTVRPDLLDRAVPIQSLNFFTYKK